MSKFIFPFITEQDYKCKHCHKLPPDFYSSDGKRKNEIPHVYEKFFKAYETFRRPWGKPIYWTSGYRCIYWNNQVGGSPISIHIFGLAGDLRCESNEEMNDLYECILEYNSELRLGKYRWKIINGEEVAPFIHFDIGYEIIPRLDKKWHKAARWTG